MKNKEENVALGFSADQSTIVLCTKEVKEAMQKINAGLYLNKDTELPPRTWKSRVKNIRRNMLYQTETLI